MPLPFNLSISLLSLNRMQTTFLRVLKLNSESKVPSTLLSPLTPKFTPKPTNCIQYQHKNPPQPPDTQSSHPEDATERKVTKTPLPLILFKFLQHHCPIIPKMPTSTSVALKAKLLKPCKKLIQVLKFRFKRHIATPFFRFWKLWRTISRRTHPKKRIQHRLLPFFGSSMRSEKSDVVGDLRSAAEMAQESGHFPSPHTPAYVKVGGGVERREAASSNDAIEDVCHSFENYLVEMIVEEGKVKDLMDVEELLYCWKNLKCPVFHDLVCRFYGELGKGLFFGEEG